MKLIQVLIGIFCVAALVKADIINDQSIEVSGSIKCCPDVPASLRVRRFNFPGIQNIKDEMIPALPSPCEPPIKARIELWDYFTIFPNVRLYWLDTEKKIEYSFRWADGKFFDVKPFLKIHAECSDGTVLDEKYDYMDTKPKKIKKDVEVTMS
uniref:Uncharacterized protein n=1 Tax=Panagrolaimus sp. ES5 TaxID=591445 RepID=A0AC34F3K9_9BILA